MRLIYHYRLGIIAAFLVGIAVGCGSDSSTTATNTEPATSSPSPTGASPVPATEAIAQAPETSYPTIPAADVGLSAEQATLLGALGIPVAIPSAIPDGFTIQDVNAGISAPGPGGGPRYSITYTGPSGCFIVESSTGGFGGPAPSDRLPVDVPLFADVNSEVLPDDYTYSVFWSEGALEGPFPEPVLFSDWIEGHETFYRVTSGMGGGDYGFCSPERRIAPEAAVALVNSFSYIATP